MNRIFILIMAVSGCFARAQVLSFRDLSAETQAQILTQLKPLITEACEIQAVGHFEDHFAELKAADACLNEQAKDSAFATYVREESAQRCFRTIEDSIRASQGQSIQVKVTSDQYDALVSDVVGQITKVNCPNGGRP